MIATCKNGVASLYFDGNLVKKESDSTPTAYFGQSWKLAPGPCSIDDVRIYNRELSEAEVKALYDYESVLIEFLPESSGTASINQSVEATLPTGGTQRYYSQSNSPNGPFSDQSIIFNGHAGNNREMLDGSHLVYRMRIIFNSEVYLKSFTEVAIGDQSAPSFIRVLDSNKVEKIRQLINGFNIRVTNSFAIGLKGSVFYIDEYDRSASWRYRESMKLDYISKSGLPKIIEDPKSSQVLEGSDLSMSVNTLNASTHQWFKDGNAVLGGTNAALTLANVRPAMIGDYTAVASNAAGSVTSSVASLSIKGVDSGIWKGLVAYYPFNGNANDNSGYANDGVKNGVVSYSNTNPSSLIASSSGYLYATNTLQLNPSNEATFSVWLKSSESNPLYSIFSKSQSDSNGSYMLYRNQVDGGSFRPHVRTSNGWRYGDVRFGVAANSWVHFIYTFSSNSGLVAFINGVNVGFSNNLNLPSKGETILSSTASLVFGEDFYDPNVANLEGAMKGFRIYNRALSETEVKSLYDYESTPPVPTVTLAPVDTSVVAGQTLTLKAGIAGANLAYRWQKDGVDLQASTRVSGVTSQSLTVQEVVASDAGSYRLTATNLTGSATTPAAVVTVLVPVSLTQQPQPVVGVEGETVQLSVTATGSPALTYQWFKDGNAVPGGTNAALNLANVRPAMIGDYTAVVGNAAGSVTSSVASLSIKGVDSGIWKGLVAYYPFNENANDESGHNRHGMLVGGAQILEDRYGQSRSAVHLNGINGFISLKTNSLTLKTNSFLDVSGTNARTFSLWVKLGAFRTPGYALNPILQYGLTGYPQSTSRGATFSMHFDNYDPSKVQVAFWANSIDLKFNEATTHYMHHVLTYDGKRVVYFFGCMLLGGKN
jgi:hypothetical protein